MPKEKARDSANAIGDRRLSGAMRPFHLCQTIVAGAINAGEVGGESIPSRHGGYGTRGDTATLVDGSGEIPGNGLDQPQAGT